jgi:hypothetical protein
MTMKAITIWQPWATLLAIGAKPYEFRKWEFHRSMLGQRIGIHAGARPLRYAEVTDLLARLQDPAQAWSTALKPDLAVPVLEALLVPPAQPVLSHMLCTAVLGEPRRGWEVAHEFGGTVNDSDRDEHSNFAWPLVDIELLVPPQPMSGAQGFWNWGGP